MESHEVWRGSWWWAAHATAKVRCTARFLPMETMISFSGNADSIDFVAHFFALSCLKKNEGMIQVNTCGTLASCVFCLGFGAPATPPLGDPPKRLRWTDSWVHSNWWMVLTWISLRWWANLNSATYIHILSYIYIYLQSYIYIYIYWFI